MTMKQLSSKKGDDARRKRARRKRSIMETLTIRYNIPRWYITLGVPAFIAALFFAGSLFIGLISLQSSGVSAAQEEFDRTAQYEALIREEGGADVVETPEVQQKTQVDIIKETISEYVNFDTVLVASFLVALGPYSYDITKTKLRIKQHEKDFAAFLFELSELIRGGIDPIRSIILLSERDVGSITNAVRIIAKQTQLGYSFEQAMRNLDKLLGSNLIKNYTDLVVQASYSGGTVSDLIRKASTDMGTFLALEEEKMAGLRQYMVILYTAQVILIGVAVMLIMQLWPGLQSLSFQGGTGGVGFLSKADIADVTVERNLFYLVIINGMMGGLVIGKISEGRIKDGLKHSLLIMIIGFGAWMLMVNPQGAGDVVVSVASQPEEGIAGLPIKERLVVNVTDSEGEPKSSALVKFTITGPGDGAKVIPPQLNSDRHGIAKATIVLGDQEGPYIVNVSVGKNTIAVPIRATPVDG
jgi:flagellar protein FlaJ